MLRWRARSADREALPDSRLLPAVLMERTLGDGNLAFGADQERSRRTRAIAVGDDAKRGQLSFPLAADSGARELLVRRGARVVQQCEQRVRVDASVKLAS